MALLMGSLTVGIIFAFLAIGVYITFRIFNFPDITADGSFAAGAAVTAILIVSGYNPVFATFCAVMTGMAAGFVTGIIHTKFKINGLLSGILVMTALYSVNLYIMGKSTIPFLSSKSIIHYADNLTVKFFNGHERIIFLRREAYTSDIGTLLMVLALLLLFTILIYLFFKTNLGMAMRATGDNPQMVSSLGADTGHMITAGIAVSNGFIALSGSLLAQYMGFADVQMGIGMIVMGLACVIIGEVLVGKTGMGLTLAGIIMGSILFRLLLALALRSGLNPNNLRMVTALFVFLAIIIPAAIIKLKNKSRMMQEAD